VRLKLTPITLTYELGVSLTSARFSKNNGPIKKPPKIPLGALISDLFTTEQSETITPKDFGFADYYSVDSLSYLFPYSIIQSLVYLIL
jgi:hypothetical protein